MSISSLKYCCGCKTCSLVCPKQAISFRLGEMGSLTPLIDSNKCIHCGLCDAVCPVKQRPVLPPSDKIYLASSKEAKIKRQSTSGGVFSVFAEWAIDNGWCVCGAAWDGLKVKHLIVYSKNDLFKLKRSKYVQSDLNNVFPVLKSLILSGKNVLFSGTPCQVSAFKNFLGPNIKGGRVLLVDVLCHGVPSQSFFDSCIEHEEKSKGIEILDFSFRSKAKNTPSCFTYIYRKTGSQKKRTRNGFSFQFPFYKAFSSYQFFLEQCYHCEYASPERVGDITLGDGWGCEQVSGFSTTGRKNGCSTVIINSDWGNSFFDEVQEKLTFLPIHSDLIASNNQAYTKCETENEGKRSRIIQDFHANFDLALTKYLSFNRKDLFRASFYENCPKWLLSFASFFCFWRRH